MPSSGSVSWEFVLSDRILWEREKDEQINTSHGRMLKSPESAKRESLRQNEDSSFSKPTWPSQRGVQRARTRKGILRATILPSCQASNLLFSVPHRLLIMALCRQLLVGITTLEELLNGDRKFIEIKPEYFDDSIFFTSGPRGLSISTGPQTSIGFTDYLRTRGQRMGYEGELSWYGIRRRAASDIARRVGAKAAREIMNHNPDSVVLEESSFDLDETREVAAIALNEPVAANGQYAALIAV